MAIVIAGCTSTAALPDAPASDAPSREAAPAGSEQGDSWRLVARGSYAAVRFPVTEVVHESQDWADVWAAIHANKSEPPTRPVVDMSRESVLLIIMGQRSTGGYDIAVTDVTMSGDQVIVTLAVTTPQTDEMVTQALTSPYIAVAIPATDRRVIFAGDDISTGYVGE